MNLCTSKAYEIDYSHFTLCFISVRGYAMASSSDDRMNEPPTSLGLVPHQVSKRNIVYGYVH